MPQHKTEFPTHNHTRSLFLWRTPYRMKGAPLLALFLFIGCHSEGMFDAPDSNIDHLQVTAQNAPLGELTSGDQVAIGYPLQYQATVFYNDGTPSEDVTNSVIWSSDATDIVTVSTSGLAQGQASGSADITASWEGVSSNASPLTVTDATASTLSISGRTATINGLPVPLYATATFSDGTQQNLTEFVTWSSSDSDIGDFTDSSNGNWFVPAASGSAQINATYSVTSLTTSTPLIEYVLFAADIDSDTPAYLSLNPATSTLAQGTSENYQVMLKINTVDTAPQLPPFNITAFLNFTSADSDVVTLEPGTNTDGEAIIRAKALQVSDGVTITATGILNGTSYTRTATLTISPATVSAINVDCGDATLSAGLDITCTANATYQTDEDISLNAEPDITDSVIWSSSDTEVMTASTTIPGLFTGVIASGADAIATLDEVSGRQSITVTDSVISSITITNTQTSVNSGETLQMNATGTTTAGTEDITSRVIWSASDGSRFSDTTPGLLSANSGITTDQNLTITASSGAILDTYTLTLSQPYSAICGTGLNDTDSTSATGACLKIASDTNGNWLTSTPSTAAMNALGYTEDNSDTNSGTSYAATLTEDGTKGPTGEFARFRQDGDGAVIPTYGGDNTNAGVNGQFDRWCQALASEYFAGKATWRRPTKAELLALYNTKNNMWSNYGWPTLYAHWSTEFDTNGNYYLVWFSNGNTTSNLASGAYYASCLAEP